MRLPLPTDLKTRTGAPDKDSRLKNCYVETKSEAVRKRPAAQGGVQVGTGIAQGGINGLVVYGDVLYPIPNGTTCNNASSYVIGDHVSVNYQDFWATTNHVGNCPIGSGNSDWSTTYVPAVPSVFPAAWTARTLNASGFWDFIIYGNKFIASSALSSSYQYSTDGITWSTGTAASFIFGNAYGNGIYLAIVGTTIQKSTDGITWSATSWPGLIVPGTIYFANGTFFICSASVGLNEYVTTTDGITWSAVITTIADIGSGGVVYGNGIYVSLDYNRFIKPFYKSTDGINWTQATTCPNGSALNQLVFGNGLFVALYSASQYATSTDGITWTNRTCPAAGTKNLAFGNGYFCMIQSGSSYVSTDGITWSLRAFPLSGIDTFPVVYGNGKFTAVKYNSNSGATLA